MEKGERKEGIEKVRGREREVKKVEERRGREKKKDGCKTFIINNYSE